MKKNIKIENKKRYQVTLSPTNVKVIKNIFVGDKLSPIIDFILSDWIEKNDQNEKVHFLEIIDILEKFRKTNDFYKKEKVIEKMIWVSKEMDFWNDTLNFNETSEDYEKDSLKELQSLILGYEITLIDNLPKTDDEFGDCENPIMKTLRIELMFQQKKVMPKLKSEVF